MLASSIRRTAAYSEPEVTAFIAKIRRAAIGEESVLNFCYIIHDPVTCSVFEALHVQQLIPADTACFLD